MADIRDEDDARSVVQSRLVPGERIAWVGRPDPAVNFTTADIYLIPFSVIWLGLAAFIFAMSLSASPAAAGSEVPFAIIPFLFVLIGVYYAVGRFFVKRWSKRRTIYAITDRRAIILSGPRSIRATPKLGQAIETKVSRDGSHESVTFGAPAPSIFLGNRTPPNTGLDFLSFARQQPFAFYDVADVAGLDGALREMLQEKPDRIANA